MIQMMMNHLLLKPYRNVLPTLCPISKMNCWKRHCTRFMIRSMKRTTRHICSGKVSWHRMTWLSIWEKQCWKTDWLRRCVCNKSNLKGLVVHLHVWLVLNWLCLFQIWTAVSWSTSTLSLTCFVLALSGLLAYGQKAGKIDSTSDGEIGKRFWTK